MLKRIWVAICLAWLAFELFLAFANQLPNDVGMGVIYYPVLWILAVPFGIPVGVAAIVKLLAIEYFVLGPGAHFSEVARVCLLWVATFYPSYWFWFRRGKGPVPITT